MPTGLVFCLKRPLLAVTSDGEKESAVSLPEQAVLRLIGPSSHHGMVDAIWLGRCVSLFKVDLTERGEEISEASVGGSMEPDERIKPRTNATGACDRVH